MVVGDFWVLAGMAVGVLVVLKFVVFSAILASGFRKLWGWLEDWCHVYQYYRIPERNENLQENQIYRKVAVYVSSLASVEDSDFANLVSGRKAGEILLRLDPGQPVRDSFLGAKLWWRNEPGGGERQPRSFVLKIQKRDKSRVLRPYLQHVHTIADELEAKRREVRLFTNSGRESGRWRSVPFTHPATIDTVAMDPDIKSKVRSDLESFLKSKQYYHRLGRVWRRSYLLHGPAGTGKTSFVAAMAKFLCYDLYDVDLARVRDDSDLKSLLLQTSPKSIILVEDVDRFLNRSGESPLTAVSLAGILGFADGIFSCCGEERVTVFTMSSREAVDPAVLRPGRLDVHIYFPVCDFQAFKILASSYLGVKDHKLFAAAEEAFQAAAGCGGGAGLISPAEIGEIMILNKGSPSRAIKSVISAIQARKAVATGMRLSTSGSRREGRGEDSGDDSVVLGSSAGGEGILAALEFRKLYGLLRMRSCGSRRGDALDPPPLPPKEAS